ncbi:MAG: carbon monoxide dehydrogenase [Chloroflexota bacterium]
MQFSGSVVIRAPRDKVWAFVTDPLAVGGCGPGVESVQRVDDTHYRAIAKIGVGFISARFAGDITLVEQVAPERAVMKLHGQAPGSAADAVATMLLRDGDEPGTTIMDWVADVTISGSLAAVGARLIEGTANKLTAQTFDCIREKLEA